MKEKIDSEKIEIVDTFEIEVSSAEDKVELLELYKIHVDLINKVSERRGDANKFYLSIASMLIISLGGIVGFVEAGMIPLICFFIGLFGILLSVIWILNIKSYQQLNSGKFAALDPIEAKLIYPFFKREWELLKMTSNADGKKKYLRLSTVEKLAPILVGAVFFIIVIIGGCLLF